MSTETGQENEEIKDEELLLIEKKSDNKYLGRASIAALDLQTGINKTNDNNNNNNNDDEELKEDELPPKGVLYRAHSLDSGKVWFLFCLKLLIIKYI